MLVFINLLLFSIYYLKSGNENKNISIIALKAMLSFSITTILITEFLSLINQINYFGVMLCWIIVFLTLVFLIFKNKPKATFQNLINYFKKTSKLEKGLIYLIGLIFLLYFVKGFLFPPNNWDALNYLLSRIMYWIGNENINHFPTHTLRQLYQPPFYEYVVMNINIIQGNDYFTNLVQTIYLFFTLFSINEILNWFKINKINKIFVFLFYITTPSVILQATNSKNDIVCAFFVVTTIYFLIKCFEKPNVSNFLYLGFSLGIGMLTKGTFYLFILPPLLIFILFILRLLVKEKNYKIIWLGIFSIFLIILINFGHFSRNYSINKHILNIDEVEYKSVSNQNMSFDIFVSNSLKNIGIHLGYPIYKESDNLIKKIHSKLSVSIEDTSLNYENTSYGMAIELTTHEDYVPNTFQFLLILLSVIFLIFYSILKKDFKTFVLTLVVVLQFIVFVLYLKWQPWSIRLHIPIFATASLLIGIFMNYLNKKSIIVFLSLIICFQFCFYFIYNNTNPLIINRKFTHIIKLDDSRLKKYFTNQPPKYYEYRNVINLIYKNNPKEVGLILTEWEYPLFADYYYEPIKLKALFVNNPSSKINQKNDNIDAIISNSKNEFIQFKNKNYINITPNNTYIWFYKQTK